jgi:hypothetical protein
MHKCRPLAARVRYEAEGAAPGAWSGLGCFWGFNDKCFVIGTGHRYTTKIMPPLRPVPEGEGRQACPVNKSGFFGIRVMHEADNRACPRFIKGML